MPSAAEPTWMAYSPSHGDAGHDLATVITATSPADSGSHLLDLRESLAQQDFQSVAARRPQATASSICANLSKWAIEHECRNKMLYESMMNSSSDLLASQHNHHHHQVHNPYPASYDNTNQHELHKLINASTLSSSSPLTKLVTNHLLEPTQYIESKLNYYFSDIWLISGDERTNKLPFIGAGPWKLIYATLVYLYLIKWLLPRLMRPFKPLELNWPIRLYNLSMVVSNLWAFYQGARILNFGTKCFGCETINHKDYSEQAVELLHYGWLFFLSRLVEWLDTIFFVLRKKERQVTKLHVFHHSFVPLISWTYLKYHPGYTVAFFPFINSFVHSVMYTYYLLATFGPKVQPYLWWKRYLTSMQIAQFVLIIIQLASIPLTGNETCQYPRGFLYVAFAGAILFLWLFFTYYIDTYNKRQEGPGRKEKSIGVKGDGEQPKKDRRAASFSLSDIFVGRRDGGSRSISDLIDNAIDDSSTKSIVVRTNKKTN